MIFGMIMENQNMVKKPNGEKFLLCTEKQVIFIKTLQKMLKLDQILQIMNQIDHYRTEKKVIGLIKDELGAKIMTKFIELEAKTYSYLIDDGNEYKKAKCTKNCVIKENSSLEVI